MEYLISASTDIGLAKATNQDSLSVKVLNTPLGKMAFAVLCDGMGGLQDGEIASATLIHAFDNWVTKTLPILCSMGEILDVSIRASWEMLIREQNERLQAYGRDNGISLGTTVVALLLTQTRYYMLNVGDSRIYKLTDRIQQISHDQSLVAQEVALGRLTEEEAETDPRNNILLQCVGASKHVEPEFVYGTPSSDTVFLLCCDGFRHLISKAELFSSLNPDMMLDEPSMQLALEKQIELVKARGERDNISALLIRTCDWK